jgi:probable F420-dependent oxidoreductase
MQRMTRLGLALSLLNPLPPEDFIALAREAEAGGFHALWTGEVAGADALGAMAVLATHTSRVDLATGVVPIQTRTPQLLAMGAATIGHLAPGRFALGLGVSSRIIVGDWHGRPFEPAVPHMREAITVIRQALAGDKVTFEGRYVRARNFRLAIPTPPRPVRIYLGALGPGMLELAGELADGVLLNWLAPRAVPACIRHLEAGARRAGRTLADFEIGAFVRTRVTDATEATRQWLARDITQYAIVDAYARFFASCGYAEEMERLNAVWRAGDRAAAVGCITDRVLDDLGVVGPAAFCRERLAEFTHHGLTQPVIVPIGPPPDPRGAVVHTVRALCRPGKAGGARS